MHCFTSLCADRWPISSLLQQGMRKLRLRLGALSTLCIHACVYVNSWVAASIYPSLTPTKVLFEQHLFDFKHVCGHELVFLLWVSRGGSTFTCCVPWRSPAGACTQPAVSSCLYIHRAHPKQRKQAHAHEDV